MKAGIKRTLKTFLAVLLVTCMLLQATSITSVEASDNENLMSKATLSSTTSVWWNSTPTLVDGDTIWDSSNFGEAVAYDGEGGVAYYQADFAEVVSLGQVRLYMYYAGSDGAAKDIAVDVKLSNGTWVRVAEKHDITYKGTHEGGDLTLTYVGSSPAMYLAMNFETIDCVAFRVSAKNNRDGVGSFRLVEIEAYTTYPSSQSVTGTVKDTNDAYNIPYIYSNVNLMADATLSSTTSVWWNSTPELVNGNTIWDPGNFGEAVAYDGDGGVAYYQADFAEEIPLGQVRLYMYYAGSDGSSKDIAVDVKLSNGTWVRVAEKHNIIYKGTHEGGDLTLTYQGSSPAMYLAMNFETVDCVAFRVSAKNNRDGVGSFRLVEIEAYTTYPSDQSVTGVVKDENMQYNIPHLGSSETIPENLKKITFSDFEIADGKYNTSKDGTYKGDSLNGTLFTGKINAAAGAKMMIGGVQDHQGLVFKFGEEDITLYNADGSLEGFDSLTISSRIVGQKLVGNDIKLQISIEYVNNDAGATANDLKLGIWFAGKLYDGQYVYINNYTDREQTFGRTMTLEGEFKLRSVKEETLPEDFKVITFTDFGLSNDTYTTDVSGFGPDFDRTVLTGVINASVGANLFIGGQENWQGIRLIFKENGIYMSNGTGSTEEFPGIDLYEKTAGVPLTGTDLELQMSFEYVNDDGGATANDLKLGMWFADKLYNGEYIYIYNYVDTMGTNLQIYGPAGAVTLTSVKRESMPENLKEITFVDFGIADGTYSTLSSGIYKGDSLNNTLLTGRIRGVKGARLIIGGVQTQQGLVFEFGERDILLYNADGSLEGFEKKVISSHIAGQTLVGKDIKLQMTFEYVNNDNGATENDLRLGIWFAGQLYNNEYIYINNYTDRSQTFGKTMTLAGTLKVRSINKEETLPEDYKVITFTDFGFDNGTYTTEVSGSGPSLDHTVLTGIINASEGANLFIGGQENWKGIRLLFNKNGIYLSNGTGNTEEFPGMDLYEKTAGVPLTGTDLELQMSFEYVNDDGGTTANDLKLGMWFAGKLYDGEYIYIHNYVDTMGSNFHIYGPTGAVTLTSVIIPIEFERFGLTENWADTLLTEIKNKNIVGGSITSPESASTGDNTTYTVWIVIAGMSLLGIFYMAFRLITLKKRRQEYDKIRDSLRKS